LAPRPCTEVTLRCSLLLEEPLSALLWQWGTAGTASRAKGRCLELRGYLPRLLGRAEACRLRSEVLEIARFVAPGSKPRVSITRLSQSFRALAWRRQFAPVRAGRGLLVVAPWHRGLAAPRVRIVIAPALAFGTGHHPTTRACLILLERLRPRGARVLDVGTGTGILGIAAAKLGAAAVLATDNDPLAVEQARANLGRNRVARRVTVQECDLVPKCAPPFDLALANIDPPTIVRLCQRMPRLLSRGGVFIASGFTSRSLPEIKAALRKARLRIEDRLQLGGWIALCCRLQ